ncbi:MAG TPA: ABC transporter substrate-binding protein [Pseudolabrys sp.]|nr:ABC transporter substrate-binding protein [Pseudolabrys sp.]
MARKIDDAEGQKQFAALRDGLAERGWSEGKTFHIETRWTVADAAEALKFAQELVRSKSEVLVANGTPSLVAMRQVTSTIPIVFVSVADPVGQRFVPSLARPGGNITGFSAEEATMGGKWLELLKELAPRVKRIAIIYNPATAPYAPMFFPAMQAASPGMAVALAISPVRTVADIERVIAGISHEAGGGLIVVPDSFMFGQRQQIIALAAKHRLPAIYPLQIFIPDGGLIAYGIERVDMFHRAADYVDRILRGASPVELPVQQPTKFELSINLKTAKALGLDVPLQLQQRADEVIE